MLFLAVKLLIVLQFAFLSSAFARNVYFSTDVLTVASVANIGATPGTRQADIFTFSQRSPVANSSYVFRGRVSLPPHAQLPGASIAWGCELQDPPSSDGFCNNGQASMSADGLFMALVCQSSSAVGDTTIVLISANGAVVGTAPISLPPACGVAADVSAEGTIRLWIATPSGTYAATASWAGVQSGPLVAAPASDPQAGLPAVALSFAVDALALTSGPTLLSPISASALTVHRFAATLGGGGIAAAALQLWVTSSSDGQLMSLDPDSGQTLATLASVPGMTRHAFAVHSDASSQQLSTAPSPQPDDPTAYPSTPWLAVGAVPGAAGADLRALIPTVPDLSSWRDVASFTTHTQHDVLALAARAARPGDMYSYRR